MNEWISEWTKQRKRDRKKKERKKENKKKEKKKIKRKKKRKKGKEKNCGLKGSGSLLFAKRGKPYSLDGAIDTLVDFNSIEIKKVS